ncbi:hypothetical protein Droror1_Dr00009832 [Drosera rotundifolia]
MSDCSLMDGFSWTSDEPVKHRSSTGSIHASQAKIAYCFYSRYYDSSPLTFTLIHYFCFAFFVLPVVFLHLHLIFAYCCALLNMYVRISVLTMASISLSKACFGN